MAPKKQNTTSAKELVKVEIIQEQRDLSAQLIQAAKAMVVKAEKFSDPKLAGQRYKTAIRNQEELDKANEIMSGLASEIKAINAKHKELKAPFLEGGRKLDAFFFGPRDILQSWLDDMKEATKQHFIRVEKKRQEEEAVKQAEINKKQAKLDEKLEEAKASGDEKAVERIEKKQEELSNAVALPSTAPAEMKSGGTRKKFKYKVVDFGKMPDAFQGFQLKVENTSVLQKIADDSNGLARIPGVEFEEDFIVVVQSK